MFVLITAAVLWHNILLIAKVYDRCDLMYIHYIDMHWFLPCYSMRLGRFLRRYPMARIFVIMYMVSRAVLLTEFPTGSRAASCLVDSSKTVYTNLYLINRCNDPLSASVWILPVHRISSTFTAQMQIRSVDNYQHFHSDRSVSKSVILNLWGSPSSKPHQENGGRIHNFVLIVSLSFSGPVTPMGDDRVTDVWTRDTQPRLCSSSSKSKLGSIPDIVFGTRILAHWTK